MLAYNPNDVKPGWIAFGVVMLLLVATFLLWRNMNKQMRKINVPYRDEFRQPGPTKGGPTPPPEQPREPGEQPPR